jgi:hypothetical protein
MLKTSSFTYTIDSVTFPPATTGNSQYEFTFDRLPQSEYFVQCTGFIIQANNLVNPPFIINLVATNLADNRNYTAGITTLNTNQLVLASIPSTQNSGANLQSGEGSVFRVKNMDMGKTVTFSLHGGNMVILPETVAPQGTVYVITFQFTPI